MVLELWLRNKVLNEKTTQLPQLWLYRCSVCLRVWERGRNAMEVR